jgi:nucleotide-binding universal stress UspA family protein
MIALKTILLPTDGSECSRKAMLYALSFAQQYGAQVLTLHVIDQRRERQPEQSYIEMDLGTGPTIRHGIEKERQVEQTYIEMDLGTGPTTQRGLEEAERRALQEVADAATKVGVAVETRLVTGIPSEDIVRIAKELSVDLIIMGTHGRTGVSHALLGSVAEKVVQQAPCPVLVVRQEEHEFVTP